jgi:orotate phosphoribosyltransferase
MNEREVLQVLGSVSAVLTGGHFVYTSGRHGSAYVNKDAVYPHTAETSKLCRAIAERFADDNVEVVIAPAVGGVILSQWVAYCLSKSVSYEVLGVYAEPSESGESFIVKRGYDKLIVGKRVLVVDDILTTGGSVKKVVDAVKAVGGEVVGVAVLCNRGGVLSPDVGNPPKLVWLAEVSLASYDEADCPLCASGVPVNINVGKGREFLARKRA